MASFFGYGTLTIPEVVRSLTGLTLCPVPGTARGFARYRLKGRKYPGMVAEANAVTPGVLYPDVGPKELQVFNAYEDDVYQTALVPVATSGRIVQALAYVVPWERRRLLTKDPWDPSWFMDAYGKSYLRMCRDFRRHFIRHYPDF